MIALNMSARNASLQGIVDAIGAGGELRLYDGERPASGGAATLQLATLPLSTIAGTVNNAELTFNPITDDAAADAEGTVTWGRIVDGAGDFVVDLDCGTIASSADIKFSVVAFTTDDAIKIISFKIFEGNS